VLEELDRLTETKGVLEELDRLTETKGVLEELDSWMRRRLRCLLWRQWKRRTTKARKLRALGLACPSLLGTHQRLQSLS
jgi:hypothetical protein